MVILYVKRGIVMQNQIPEKVNIRNVNGNIVTIPYRELKHHEESIIEDNIMYGLVHNEYSQKDIDDYEKQAKSEWKELRQKLRNNPELLLTLDRTTERYVPYTEGAEII